MTIAFDDTLVAHFFVPLPPNGHSDWMGGISEIGPSKFKLVHRFRHADPVEPGADPFEGIDRKNWYEGTFGGISRTEAIARVHMIAKELAAAAGTEAFALIREEGETTDAFLMRFTKQPYAHVKVVDKEEWEKTYGGDKTA